MVARAGFRMTLASFVDSVALITHFWPPLGHGTLELMTMAGLDASHRTIFPSAQLHSLRTMAIWVSRIKILFLSRWRFWVDVKISGSEFLFSKFQCFLKNKIIISPKKISQTNTCLVTFRIFLSLFRILSFESFTLTDPDLARMCRPNCAPCVQLGVYCVSFTLGYYHNSHH